MQVIFLLFSMATGSFIVLYSIFLTRHRDRIKKLQSESEKANASLNYRIKQLKETLKEYQTGYKSLSDENTKLKININELKGDMGKLRININELSRNNQKLLTNNRTLAHIIKAFNDSAAKQTKEYENLVENFETLHQRHERDQRAKRKLQQRCQAYEEEVENGFVSMKHWMRLRRKCLQEKE